MDLAQRRLRNQYVNGSTLVDPAEVVRALGAVQAQDYLAALWAVGLRLRSARQTDIERAISERRVVRTWPMRGTLHFVAAEDVRWMLELLAPRTLQRNAARLLRDFAINRTLIKRATKIIEAALSSGQALTRAALYERLDAGGITTDKQRGMHVLWWLAHEGLICCGPRAGKQQTFVLLDEWVPGSSHLTPEGGLALLSQRYFSHHGPATVADFAWWAGLTLRDANLAIEASASQLISETENGTTWWSGVQERTKRSAVCHLLPVYDEFTVGYADRSASLDPSHSKHAAAGHGIFKAPIIIRGRVVGNWTRQLKKDRVEIQVTPLTRLSRKHDIYIKQAAKRYGAFLGLQAKVNS